MPFYRVYYTRTIKSNLLIEADSPEDAKKDIEKRNIDLSFWEVTKVVEEPGWYHTTDGMAEKYR